jgi:hypothetical protein
MHEVITQIEAKRQGRSYRGIHPLKLLAYLSGLRSGTRVQRQGVPRWLGEYECGIRQDAEEHWWWMRGFDAGYRVRDPVQELANLRKPQR